MATVKHFSQGLHPNQHESAKTRFDIWRRIVDEIHRADIRQWGFLQPYGYVLGMTLAQQYGFTSELLDFTSQPAVAIFFATHADPYYLFAPAVNIVASTHSDIGVVYRLPSNEGEIVHERIDSFDYYTCPPQVHMSDVCRRFEDRSSPEMLAQLQDVLDEETMAMMLNGSVALGAPSALLDATGSRTPATGVLESIDQFLRLYYEGGGIRYYRLLDLPQGAFAGSRMGRQAAVAVIVGELRRTTHHPDGDYATFQAVEDVSTREGFERFYFRHTDEAPHLSPICREYLWPENDDYFETLISRVVDPDAHTYRFQGSAVPKRIDLVSRGFLRA